MGGATVRPRGQYQPQHHGLRQQLPVAEGPHRGKPTEHADRKAAREHVDHCPRKRSLDPLQTLKPWLAPAAMLFIIVLICGIAAYTLVLKGRQYDDDSGDGSGYDDVENVTYIPQLLCVVRTAPGSIQPTFHPHPFIACKYIIYYPEVGTFDTRTLYSYDGIEVLVGLNVNDSDSEALDEHYQQLGRWVGRRYAILDFDIASDFSDVGTAYRRINDVLSRVKKPGHHEPQLRVLGIRIQPKDADATKQNGAKLAAIAKSAIIIFQTHEPPDTEQCKIGINQLMISKANYHRLADGMNNSVAISTTLGIVKFTPTDPAKKGPGAPCDSREILSRTSANCASMGPLTKTGHQVNGDFVYEYTTNASALQLLVTCDEQPDKTLPKFNIAFFDVDLYLPAHNGSCPEFNLADFYRKPRSAGKTGK